MKSLITITLAATLSLAVFSNPVQQSAGVLAFRNVDVFDGSRMIRGTTVLVRGGMIRAVGSDIVIPPSAQVVDGKGKTLLPGFLDAHTHLGMMFGEQFLRDALNFGVTTELEMWGGDSTLTLKKKMAAGGYLDIADLRTAGTGVTVPHGHPTQMGGPAIPTLGPSDDVQAFVDARIAEGADYIKIIYEHAYPTLTKQQIEDVVAAAHRRNKLVVVHISTQRDARDAITAGVDGLVHIFADTAPEPDFAELAAQHHVFIVPTLTVIEAFTGASDNSWWKSAPHVLSFITPSMRNTLEMKMTPRAGSTAKFTNAQEAVGALRRKGVPILAGTDAPAPSLAHGLSIHRELELLVLSGLTPLEALASATSEPACSFGFHDRGRIAEGKRADLLLVNGDPSVDIKATRDIVGVWKLGVQYTRPSSPR
jgi:imidazolonepropionase-like amidohydrolase